MDWIAKNIYWTDATYNWVMMANIEATSMYRILIDSGLHTPTGIAVHPGYGYRNLNQSSVNLL